MGLEVVKRRNRCKGFTDVRVLKRVKIPIKNNFFFSYGDYVKGRRVLVTFMSLRLYVLFLGRTWELPILVS